MDYRTLRFVIAVAEEGSMCKAAKRLFLSQPSISHCIGKQEKKLGVLLFDRTRHPLSLTYAGERYVSAAREILGAKDRLKKEMEDIRQRKNGRVILGLTKPCATYLLPHALQTFRTSHPDIRLELVEDINAALESQLVNGALDLAILLEPLEDELLEHKRLYADTLCLCLPSGHPLSEVFAKEGVDLKRLENEPMVLYKPEQRMRKTTDSLLRLAGIVPRAAMESQTAETILNLVSTGMGCAFLPASVVHNARVSRKIEHFEVGPALIGHAFAWRRDSQPSQAAQIFMRTVEQFFEKNGGQAPYSISK